MKFRITVVSLLLVITAIYAEDQQSFKRLWYDGNAEISTYALKESRYGEIRTGTRVMVFVTEPMRIATHIKPDVRLPEDQKIRVLKLNDIRRFTTGIYDYHVMTSVFTAVEQKAPFRNMNTMKVAFSSQEWCGQVFDRIVRTSDGFEGALFSYFESEGEASYSVHEAGVETEENLWIRIRELNGPFLGEGESVRLRLIPSRWIIRKSHSNEKVVDATVGKGVAVLRKTTLGMIRVTPFTWNIGNGSTTVFVEKEYPHRIVEFQERDGSSGTLIATQREPYWKQNANRFFRKREELGLNP